MKFWDLGCCIALPAFIISESLTVVAYESGGDLEITLESGRLQPVLVSLGIKRFGYLPAVAYGDVIFRLERL